MPGCIDAHSHVGGTGPDGSRDINEMVYQTNPELRVLDVIRPNNEATQDGGRRRRHDDHVHPRLGHEHGRLGRLMKTGPGKLDDVLIRFPGVLKIAQAGNPERQGGEVGSGRMGMNYVIRDQLREGMGYTREWDDYEAGRRKEKPATNLRLEYFRPLFHREIPVVVHTQQYQVVMSTLRILHDEMNLKVVIDHGTFDAFKLAEEIKKRKIPADARAARVLVRARRRPDQGDRRPIRPARRYRSSASTRMPRSFPKRNFRFKRRWRYGWVGMTKRRFAA